MSARSLLLLLVSALFWTFACTSNLEADLRKAAAGPDSVVIVKTSEGGYLAFPGVGVKKIEGNNVTLKAQTFVTKGSGTMPEASIVREIRDTRAKANPGGFGQTEKTISSDGGSLTIKNEVLDSETVIEVAEIISPSGKTDDERSAGTEVPGAPVKPDPAVSSVERTPQQIGPGGEGAPTGGLPERVAEAPVQPKKVGPSQTIQGGVLNSSAVSLPQPEYPTAARSQKVSGPVSVRVTVNETGNVVDAAVLKGHPLLNAAAVDAARKAKFRPTMLSGQPVKVTGVVNYNFVLQ